MKKKVVEINLERGMPTVDQASLRLVNEISTAKMQGCKAAIIIHGYGSTGEGGSIKASIKRIIGQPRLVSIVKDTVSGEDWLSKKNNFLSHCPQLNEHNRHINGNKGITVVLIK